MSSATLRLESGEKLLFEGDDIRVTMKCGSVQRVIFSFSGFKSHLTPDPRYGAQFLERTDASCVFFVALKDNWWQSPEMVAAIAAANEATKDLADRVTYGQSMGGFGALQFAERLGARFLATAPQSTVNTRLAPLHPVWAECIAQQPIVYDDVLSDAHRADGVIVFDPRDAYDSRHAALLADWSHSRLIFPFATHYIPRALAECGIVSEITLAIFQGDRPVSELRSMIRKRRIYSPTYLEQLAKTLVTKSRHGLLSIVHRYILEKVLSSGGDLLRLPHIAQFLNAHHFTAVAEISPDRLSGTGAVTALHDVAREGQEPGTYRALGNDSQFRVRLVESVTAGQLEVKMISSVAACSDVYWRSSGLGWSSAKREVRPVRVGYNVISFQISDVQKISDLRFDPLDRTGIFHIISISWIGAQS